MAVVSSKRAAVAIVVALAASGTGNTTPPADLKVVLEGLPAVIAPGASLGPEANVIAQNTGEGMAAGSRTDQAGYMIDLILSTDEVVPEGFATFSSNFVEDALLRGGRYSNTPDIDPGGTAMLVIDDDSIPADTRPGEYFLCARIDPGDAVAEADEINNFTCVPILVQAPPAG